MRLGGVVFVAVVLLAAGCGSSRQATTVPTATARVATAAAGLRVGIAGPLRLDVQGAVPHHGTLAQIAGDPLVLVDAHVATPAAVAVLARAHPSSHFAVVGASARPLHVPNLAGIVLEEDAAAYLAGMTAGLAAVEEGGDGARVAWVGPQEEKLAAAFGRGVHAAAPHVAVLHQWSRAVPARCKEAALTGLGRGAVVVVAHGGLCALAAASGAHEQNLPALRLGDFELPDVAAGLVVREALGGVFHGGQDVLFGPETGAIGVRRLDQRISPTVAAQVRAAAQELASGVSPAG